MTRAAAPALAALLVANAAPCAAGGYLQANGLLTALDGTLQMEEGPAGPADLDLEETLGFGRDVMLEARAGVSLPGLRLGVGGGRFRHSVTHAVADFPLGDQTFDATASFDHHLDWAEAEIGLGLPAPPKLKLALVAGARWYRWEARARGEARPEGGGPVLEREESLDVSGPVPHLGMVAELRPGGPLVVRGGLRGFVLGVEGGRGEELDLDVSAGVELGGKLEVGGGWRRLHVTVNAEKDDLAFDLDYQGLQAYARLNF